MWQPLWWGTVSMIDAERRLLANALLDLSNQRFVLLSETCIPLFNFTTIYRYLTNSKLNFLSLYDDRSGVGRGRYRQGMWPPIALEDWRKGSQWFEIDRVLALRIASDKPYYDAFSKFCLPPCYSDEHYLPTLVNILYGESNSNRSVTYVDWSQRGAHPRRFERGQINRESLDRIRFGSECIYNGNNTRMCYLFARKFHPNALEPLLKMAPVLFGWTLESIHLYNHIEDFTHSLNKEILLLTAVTNELLFLRLIRNVIYCGLLLICYNIACAVDFYIIFKN